MHTEQPRVPPVPRATCGVCAAGPSAHPCPALWPPHPLRDLEAEEGAAVRDLPRFNARAREVHVQRQLTRAAMALRAVKQAMAKYQEVRAR